MPRRINPISDEMTDVQVLCRTLGHMWDQIPNSQLPDQHPRIPGYRITLSCARGCGKIRREAWTHFGQLVSRSYNNPEGYSTVSREVATKETFRAEMIRRRRADFGNPVRATKAVAARKAPARRKATG